jgi:DNA-binding response OmpR family regulator
MECGKKCFLAVTANLAYLSALSQAAEQVEAKVEGTGTGAQAFRRLLEASPDLVFLDTAIKDMSAASWLGVLRSMKEGRDQPVIVIGEKMGPEELAGYFEQGADDCIPLRGCDPRELAARLRAVLRRRSTAHEPAAPMLTEGPVSMNLAAHRCLVNGKEIPLRPREFELLELLVKKAGRVLSRPYLLEFIWGMASDADTRAVDVTVSRLRKALGPKAGPWLQSVSKFGYRFSKPQ